MSNFLTPIKVLLNMDVKTKSTYRAALEGLDQAMIQILDRLNYDPHGTNSTVELYRQPTDVRLEAAKERLFTFATNKEVGLIDFVKHAHNIMYEFLEVVKLGYLKDMSLDGSGMFKVEFGCILHQSGIENNASEKKRFEDQLKYLDELGLEVEQVSGLNSYRFLDNDNNRSIIRQMLSDRGAALIKINAYREEIDKIAFTLDPKNLHNFTENPFDYTLPKTDELNDDEMIKMKKLVREIPSSLAFIKESPDMLQTCTYLAEANFAEICEIAEYEGTIFKRVKERHAKEKAANMNIRGIEKEIGSQFPVEIARDVMEKIAATMAYFCMANLHSTLKDIAIDQWGILRMNIKWSSRSSDMRYAYYFSDKYKEPEIPEDDRMQEVFDVVESRNGGIRLIDSDSNRNTIASFVKSVCDFDIDGIFVSRDSCYVESTVFGEDVRLLENIFVIDSISASTDNIFGILRQHDLCRMGKN